MSKETGVSKYVLMFAVVYAATIAAVSVVFSMLGDSGGSAAPFVALIAAAAMVGGRFVKDEKRVPDNTERSRLIWLSLFTAIVVSSGLTAAYLVYAMGAEGVGQVFEQVSRLGPLVIAVVIGIMFLMHYLALWFAYGWLTRKQYAAVLKKA